MAGCVIIKTSHFSWSEKGFTSVSSVFFSLFSFIMLFHRLLVMFQFVLVVWYGFVIRFWCFLFVFVVFTLISKFCCPYGLVWNPPPILLNHTAGSRIK